MNEKRKKAPPYFSALQWKWMTVIFQIFKLRNYSFVFHFIGPIADVKQQQKWVSEWVSGWVSARKRKKERVLIIADSNEISNWFPQLLLCFCWGSSIVIRKIHGLSVFTSNLTFCPDIYFYLSSFPHPLSQFHCVCVFFFAHLLTHFLSWSLNLVIKLCHELFIYAIKRRMMCSLGAINCKHSSNPIPLKRGTERQTWINRNLYTQRERERERETQSMLRLYGNKDFEKFQTIMYNFFIFAPFILLCTLCMVYGGGSLVLSVCASQSVEKLIAFH